MTEPLRIGVDYMPAAAIDAAFARLTRKTKPPTEADIASLLSQTAIVAAAAPVPPSGIYFLIVRGRVMYVGRSGRIIQRVAQHADRWKFDAWHYVPCPVRRLATMERAYIDALMPPWNKDHLTAAARRKL